MLFTGKKLEQISHKENNKVIVHNNMGVQEDLLLCIYLRSYT